MEYKTKGTCSRKILYEIENNIVTDCKFIGGCDGNTKGVAKLVVGMPVEAVIERLEGIDCRGRGTSCPDQLAKALKEYVQQTADRADAQGQLSGIPESGSPNCEICPGKDECQVQG